MDFEHVGNAPCLELANSVPDRREEGDRDWLGSAEIADGWARSLDLELASTPSGRDLADLRAFREDVFETFTAIASGTQTPQRSLNSITDAHSRSLKTRGYRPSGRGIVRDWPRMWDVPSLIALFADSALKELTGDRLDRVKSCPSCGWLFVDTSRNRSRRWCSMQTCGGRDKALRHYRKTRD